MIGVMNVVIAIWSGEKELRSATLADWEISQALFELTSAKALPKLVSFSDGETLYAFHKHSSH
jgi:hypothetical protein